MVKQKRSILIFLQELVDPKGKVSAPATMGIIACLFSVFGHFSFSHIQDANTLFWQGLGAIGIAGGETITNIAGTTFGSKNE